MTTFKTFAATVISEMENRLPDYEISEVEVTKMNDVVLHGVTARHTDSDVAPTMYLNAVFEDYRNGQSIESIVENLVSVVLDAEMVASIKRAQNVDFSYENIKDRITARLIDTELNQSYLNSHPFGLIGAGLAIVAEVNINDCYKCVITNDVAKQFNLDMSLVFETAIENMQKKYPALFMRMEDALFGSKTNILTDGGYIENMGTLMGDEANGNGATAIAYKGISETIRDIIGNYYILPSSVHELIILRDNGLYNADDLKDMVTQANRSVVDEIDRLSDSVFYYDGTLHRVA